MAGAESAEAWCWQPASTASRGIGPRWDHICLLPRPLRFGLFSLGPPFRQKEGLVFLVTEVCILAVIQVLPALSTEFPI
jgi:hypothetical protein